MFLLAVGQGWLPALKGHFLVLTMYTLIALLFASLKPEEENISLFKSLIPLKAAVM